VNNFVVRLHDRLAPDVAFATRSAAVATRMTGGAVMRSYDLHAGVAEVRAMSGTGCRNEFDGCDGSKAQIPILLFGGCQAGTYDNVPVASYAGMRVACFSYNPRSQFYNIVLCHDSHATPLPPSNQE